MQKGMSTRSCSPRLKFRATSTKLTVSYLQILLVLVNLRSAIHPDPPISALSVSNSLTSVDQALYGDDEDKLYKALSSPALGLQSLRSKNKGWYLKQLMADRETKEQVMEEK